MINKKSYNSIIIFLFVILSLFSVIGIVKGENELYYQKYNIPVFSLGKEPLIYTYNTSYSLENIKYEKPFYSSSDNNLYLAYNIGGKKYLGRNVNLGSSCIPPLFYDVQAGSPISICMDAKSVAPNGTIIIPEVMIHYATTIPEIDEYVNNPTYEGEIFVHYIVKNPNISEVSPIIFNLGKLPILVNDENVADVLNKPILNDTILIFGSIPSMIMNKGNSNLVQLSMTADFQLYMGPSQLTSFPRIIPYFSYIFYEDHGDYFLKIQRTTQIQEGTLSLTFRPVEIDYTIKIVDPIIESTLNFLDNAPERLRFKPYLQIYISNNEIHQLNFTFVKNGNLKYQTITLYQNGTYLFNEYVDAYGNSFLYPFDSYTSKIIVSPPLLISDHKEISTQSNSGFDADIEIEYNNIIFKLSRSLESKIAFIIGLIVVILGLLSLLLKPEKDVRMILVSFVGVIILIISLYTLNGLNHIMSIGSILIVISIILTIIIYYKHGMPSKIQPADDIKIDKVVKKKH